MAEMPLVDTLQNFKKYQSTVRNTVGALLIVVALYTAYAFHFKHFYELLVLGMSLCLYGPTKASLPLRSYMHMYLVFIFAGVLGDLVMGQWWLKLWVYNYDALWEYILIYILIYPIAGLVMLQSYLYLRHIFVKRLPDKVRNTPDLKMYGIGIGLIFLASLALIAFESSAVVRKAALFIILSLVIFCVFTYASHRSAHMSLLQDIANSPRGTWLALLVATYSNAFLHEIPNVTARQWTYAVDRTSPLSAASVHGIPLIILIGWLLLLILPISAFYYREAKHLSKSN